MALILYGPTVAQARGKLGGTVFSRNAAGDYMRLKVSPVQPRTSKQLSARAAATHCAQYWRDTMTSTMRDSWNVYASLTPLPRRLGCPKPRSGIAMFIRYNSLFARLNLALLTTAPHTPGEAEMAVLTLTGSVAQGVQCTDLDPTIVAGDLVTVGQSPGAMSQARNFYGGPFTRNSVIDTQPPAPITLIAAALCAIGQRWMFQTRMYAKSGKVGPTWMTRVDILT